MDKVELSPLELRSRYTRDEILVALGCWTLAEQRDVREGVLHLPSIAADVLFVTLNKTESEYSPTTLYEDYAISEDLFHWQSQSTTSAQSPTGQRYIHHAERGHSILLFVREEKRKDGLACPYDFLGPVTYQSHTGSRPMSIIWRLQHPIPASLLPAAARTSAAQQPIAGLPAPGSTGDVPFPFSGLTKFRRRPAAVRADPRCSMAARDRRRLVL